MADQKKPLSQRVVSGRQAVTLLGGGAFRPADLRDALALAPLLVAADGGADTALANGIEPAAVIGDFDSLSPGTRARIPPERLHEISEQDSTDFDKALRHIDAPLVLAVGFTGARLDHELAAFHTLVARPEHRCIVLGEEDVVFHLPPRIALDLTAGTRVSLFPLAEVTGRSEGLRWPIDGLVFHPARRIGTSNAAMGGPVTIRTDGPGLLALLPRSSLQEAARALGPADTAIGDV